MTSLSNLLKQHYIIEEKKAVRIINSDSQLEERLSGMKASAPKTTISEETVSSQFQEGVLLENAEEVVLPTPEEIHEKAQQEAEAILTNAKEQAQMILRDADEQAQSLFNEQKQKGYQEGTEQLQKENEQLQEQLKSNYTEKEWKLQKEYQARLDSMEKDIVDALIQVFEKVFHVQFEDKREIILYLAKNTIEQNETDQSFRIRVSEENKQYLCENETVLRESLPDNVKIEIVQDRKMGLNDCVIETDTGVFDCGFDTEFSNLIKDIRTLS